MGTHKKKFFVILGALFLAFIVVGIVFVAIKGNALDKESRAYADAAIPAIVGTWSEKELLDRASPELRKVVTTDQMDRLFRWVGSLGQLQKCEPVQGQALMSATTQNGQRITAEYTAKATFPKGEATIKLALIKHDDRWQILRFHVDSPALVPP